MSRFPFKATRQAKRYMEEIVGRNKICEIGVAPRLEKLWSCWPGVCVQIRMLWVTVEADKLEVALEVQVWSWEVWSWEVVTQFQFEIVARACLEIVVCAWRWEVVTLFGWILWLGLGVERIRDTGSRLEPEVIGHINSSLSMENRG